MIKIISGLFVLSSLFIYSIKGYSSTECFDNFSNMNCCNCSLSSIYLGVDGGWCTGVTTASHSFKGGGTSFRDFSSSAEARVGYQLGASLGYLINPCLRVDLSYGFLSNPYKWETSFSQVSTSSYDGRLHAHIALLNGYWHLNSVCDSCINFSPYVFGGIGVSWNDLFNVYERDPSGLQTTLLDSNWTTNFAARFGIGFLKFTCSNLIWDFGCNVYYIGKVRTGDFRQNLVSGISTPIVPFKFQQNWLGTLSIGLKCSPFGY